MNALVHVIIYTHPGNAHSKAKIGARLSDMVIGTLRLRHGPDAHYIRIGLLFMYLTVNFMILYIIISKY